MPSIHFIIGLILIYFTIFKRPKTQTRKYYRDCGWVLWNGSLAAIYASNDNVVASIVFGIIMLMWAFPWLMLSLKNYAQREMINNARQLSLTERIFHLEKMKSTLKQDIQLIDEEIKKLETERDKKNEE